MDPKSCPLRKLILQNLPPPNNIMMQLGCLPCRRQPVIECTEDDLCPGCHQQLYKHESSGRRVPLTIPQLVERGHCLKCHQETGTHASSDHEEEEEEFFSVPHSDLPSMNLPPMQEHHSHTPNTSHIPAGQAVYHGPYNARGEKHGQGEMIWSNGDVYRGMFVHDQRHGPGTLTFQAGGEYVGEWSHNTMHGTGTRRFANGDVYMGAYVEGHRTGEGRFYYANGDLYVGMWRDNHMHGPGRYYYASGQRFEGTMQYSKRVGKGKLQKSDGTVEIFLYVNDARVGQGVRWNAARTKAWRLWKPHKTYERKRISAAEAVSLVYEMDVAAGENQQENVL